MRTAHAYARDDTCSGRLGRGGRWVVVGLAATVLGTAAFTSSSAATPGESIVAQAGQPRLAVYRSPRAHRPFLVLKSPLVAHSPLVLLVRMRTPGWVRVWLPVRPDESSGWVHASAVRLALDPYRITVSLSAHRVWAYDGSRLILETPAGVGRSVLPTPVGTYFVAVLLQQPDADGFYGPYAFGLSAYSDVLYSFGGGPGEIGLHGTNDPAGLGTNVSHGCVRIANWAITRLARVLPLGTPVEIER